MSYSKNNIKRKLKNVAKTLVKKKPKGDTSINPMFPRAGVTKNSARRYKNGGCTKHK